jgi:hypothetical protein
MADWLTVWNIYLVFFSALFTLTISSYVNDRLSVTIFMLFFFSKKVSSKVKEIIVRCLDHDWLSSADRLGQIKIPISELEVKERQR